MIKDREKKIHFLHFYHTLSIFVFNIYTFLLFILEENKMNEYTCNFIFIRKKEQQPREVVMPTFTLKRLKTDWRDTKQNREANSNMREVF